VLNTLTEADVPVGFVSGDRFKRFRLAAI